VLLEARRVLRRVGELQSSIGVRMLSPFTVRLWRIASHHQTPLERCGSPVSRSLVQPKSGCTPGSFMGRDCMTMRRVLPDRQPSAYSR